MSTKLKAGTVTSGAVIDADTTGALELQTGSTPTTALSIDSSQNVTVAKSLNVATTSGYLGVGTASPTRKLTVADTGQDIQLGVLNTGTAASDDSFVLIQTSGTGTTATISGLYFGDGDSSTTGRIHYNHDDDSFDFYTNATSQVNISSTGIVTGTAGNLMLVQGTSQATTSGTSKVFTGIPSWVTRITVIFSGVSTNGTAVVQVQLGTGATPTYTTSGYSSISSVLAITGGVGGATSTTGFNIGSNSASSVRHGQMVITNISGNTWVASHAIGDAGANYSAQGGGNVALGATLTAVRVITTDTFDAGSVNIIYE